MTLDEVKAYYQTGYKFHQMTRMSARNWKDWAARGYIPLGSQRRLEELSEGELVVRFEDLGAI